MDTAIFLLSNLPKNNGGFPSISPTQNHLFRPKNALMLEHKGDNSRRGATLINTFLV